MENDSDDNRIIVKNMQKLASHIDKVSRRMTNQRSHQSDELTNDDTTITSESSTKLKNTNHNKTTKMIVKKKCNKQTKRSVKNY